MLRAFAILAVLLSLAEAAFGAFFGSHRGVSAIVSAVEKPGPSFSLWQNPYYTCNSNYYVNAGTGSDSNDGKAATTGGGHGPWATLPHANSVNVAASGSGSWCINVAPGTYASGPGNIAFSGTAASPTGYIVWRCTAPAASQNLAGGSGFSGSGCLVTDNGNPWCGGAQSCAGTFTNYMIADGFKVVNTSQGLFAAAFSCSNGDTGPTSSGCHHWIFLNNEISGFGLSGIQMNNTEWVFSLHNVIYANSQNSGCDNGAQGSGISYAAALPLSSYSQTTDDIGPTPKLGIYGSTNPNPFHQYIEFNVIYNNHMVGCGVGSGSTDGNGIILDSFDEKNCNVGGTNTLYPSRTLLAFNVVYNNGGGGIHTPCSPYTTIANNSVFNNRLDTNNSGTGRGNMDTEAENQIPALKIMINNASYAVLGTGILSNNDAALVGGSTSVAYYNGGTSCGLVVDGVTDCGSHNITYMKNFTGSPGGEVAIFGTNPAWDCTANTCQTDPKWTNVDGTNGNSGSAGTEDTQPTGINFALGSGSPALSYAITRPYLPSWVKDAGACDSSLTTCP